MVHLLHEGQILRSSQFCPPLSMQYKELFDTVIPHSQDEGHMFGGIKKSLIYSFLIPCYKWLLRVKLRGEAGLMNGFCLPLYYFFYFSYTEVNLIVTF